MSPFESQYLLYQWLLLIVQIGILSFTVIFYSRLVENDNTRSLMELREQVKKSCKVVLGRVDSPGALQRAGEKLRKRYPEKVLWILQAYVELLDEKPDSSRPELAKFLKYMEGVEPGFWPPEWKALGGRLDVYEEQS